MLGTTDINAVGAADTIGLALTTSQTNPLPEQLAYFDDISGDLTKTVSLQFAAADADNEVVIINRGTGYCCKAMDENTHTANNNGYTLQYARITETTF